MLRPYQKAYLKSLANQISHRYLLGKGEIDETFLEQLNLALEAKELIKVGLLQNCPLSPAEVSASIEERLGAETVQIIGRVIVVYRRSEKNPRIQIPVRKP